MWTKREFTEEGSPLGQLVDQVSHLLPPASVIACLWIFIMDVADPTLQIGFISSVLSVSCACSMPVSPQGLLNLRLSSCLCLLVINSRWAEHSDGSAQSFGATLTKAETSTWYMCSLWISHFLQFVILQRSCFQAAVNVFQLCLLY